MKTVTVTFAQATFVLATFGHGRNISAVTDLILIIKARLRQVQGKVMAMSKLVQVNVRASSWQGQGEDKTR